MTLLSGEAFCVDDPVRGFVTLGTGRTIENGGQEILAAAMVMLD